MAAIPNRSVVYVAEGGVLRVFDTSTGAEIPGKVNIVGQGLDVKLVTTNSGGHPAQRRIYAFCFQITESLPSVAQNDDLQTYCHN